MHSFIHIYYITDSCFSVVREKKKIEYASGLETTYLNLTLN